MRFLRHPIFILVALAATSAFLRFNNLGHGFGFHPDERHIVMTLEKMSWENLSPGFFAYGSFPFYLAFFSGKLLAHVNPWLDTYDGLFILGRCLSVAFGVATVLLTYLVGAAVFGKRSIAITAALLLSFNVLHLQLSRFFAFDVILAALCTAALFSALLILRGNCKWGIPLTGIFWGLAIATKISALSLGAPLVLSLILRRQIGNFSFVRTVGYIVLLVTTAALVFAMAEPYAFVEWTLFKLQNLEQINMTRGEWRPPYTIQYSNTAPFLYPLEQMAKWTFWWPAFIAVMVGLVAMLFPEKQETRKARWMLFTWVAVAFISMGGLQVKFPRYFLPIYPALCIFGAWGIDVFAGWLTERLSLRRRSLLPAILNCCVLIPSALFAFAFRGIYDQPHSYPAASEWIYENIPRGSSILGFHWDDKLPLTIPGFDPFSYNYDFEKEELRAYELPDNPAKLLEMAQQLEKADYLAWPTPRIPGSLPRVPDEYPRTLALLHMLYSGELGYTLEYTFKTRPTLFGYEWRDDALDESFSVYDHPKVTIFKKIRHFTADQLVSLIEAKSLGDNEIFTRDEFLEIDKDSPRAPPASAQSTNASPFAIIIWFIVLEVVAFASWPILASLFPSSLDRGYLLSKTFGVLLFGLLAWALGMLGAIQMTRAGMAVVIILMSFTAVVVFLRSPLLRYELNDIFRERAFATEGLFFSITLFFMVVKSFQPEIFWGEKPMDFGMLNYFLRMDSLPPQDPWAAGHTLQYYYLGTFIISSLIKITGVPPEIGFNLGMILVSSLVVVGSCAIFSCFTRYTFLAIVGALFFFFSSNFEVLHLWFQNKIHSFDLFWASSRVLASPAFAEYPLWSFLFGDLHAHVIALPFTLLLLGLGLSMFREWFNDEREYRLAPAMLYGVVLGSLFAINTWDCISYSIFSAPLFFAMFISNERKNAWLTIQERLKLFVARCIAAAIGMAAVIVPYSQSATARVQLHWGSVYREEFNSPENLFFFNGHWFLLLAIASFCLIGASLSRYHRKMSRGRWLVVGLLSLIPTVFTVLSRLDGADGTPWAGVVISTAIIFLSGIPLIFPIKQSRILFFSISGLAAGIIFAGSEIFFLFDRMNTIFKFYSALWSLLGVCAIGGMLLFIEGNQRRPQFLSRRLEILIPPLLVILPIFLITFSGTIINLHAMTTFRRIDPIVRPTLDGMAYLTKYNPEESALYRWIRTSVTGAPVLLEAQGDGYREYARVQMNTGLPIVLGWEHHVSQRGVPRRDIEKRRNAIAEIYSTLSMERTRDLIKKYHIELIVIGKPERDTYDSEGLNKFTEENGFKRVFHKGDTELFATPLSPLNRQIAVQTDDSEEE